MLRLLRSMRELVWRACYSAATPSCIAHSHPGIYRRVARRQTNAIKRLSNIALARAHLFLTPARPMLERMAYPQVELVA